MTKRFQAFEQRITITVEGDGYKDSYIRLMPGGIDLNDALDWFENQVLPALGYGCGKKKVDSD